MRRHLQKATVHRARQLRDDTTQPERWLWSRLKDLRRHGFHFRRHVPFRGYYLDFAEHHLKLVIELDGDQHGADAHAQRDAERDAVLVREGYRVLRIPNWRLREEFESVFAFIVHEAEMRHPPPDPANAGSTSPPRGG